jgi:S1-C subfamily serine protease
MSLEIRILSGALAGQAKRFDQAVVVVGRQGGLDLRFDPQQDLDVSSRHAEIRTTEEGFVVTDVGSTNGTYVNGKKISGPTPLTEGDKVRFGAKGPETQIHFTRESVVMMRAPLRSTEQRIAIAVNEQTAGIKKAMIAAGLVIVLGGGATAFYLYRQSATRTEEFNKVLADNERMRVELAGRLGGFGDTALANEIQRKGKALEERLAAATTDAERTRIRAEMQENDRRLRGMVQIDMQSIFRRNAPAVAYLNSAIDGKTYAGTGFAISKEGHIITNRHNVLMDGKRASQIAVKMTNTGAWLQASIVKVSDDDADIALIKINRPDYEPFPVVEGVMATAADVTEGMSLVTIGYPLGTDLPMEGEGNDAVAKSTLNSATVSKKTSAVLQMDSYAAHGSSGSPVFNASGRVVGLVWGGAKEANGRIVFAVPPEKIAAFIPTELKAIIKP